MAIWGESNSHGLLVGIVSALAELAMIALASTADALTATSLEAIDLSIVGSLWPWMWGSGVTLDRP